MSHPDKNCRKLLESISDGVWYVDGSLTIRYANRGMKALLGFPKKEQADRPLGDFLDDDSCATVRNIFSGGDTSNGNALACTVTAFQAFRTHPRIPPASSPGCRRRECPSSTAHNGPDGNRLPSSRLPQLLGDGESRQIRRSRTVSKAARAGRRASGASPEPFGKLRAGPQDSSLCGHRHPDPSQTGEVRGGGGYGSRAWGRPSSSVSCSCSRSCS